LDSSRFRDGGLPFETQVGWYGAVTGSNEFRDADTVVVFGLPLLPDTWAPNVYFALQGVQGDEWFSDEERRVFGRHRDIRRALKHGKCVVDITQALNRSRMRKTVDPDGNCHPVDVYLALPSGEGKALADDVLDGLRRELPGVRIVEDGWSLEAALRNPPGKRSLTEESLRKFVATMPVVEVEVSAWKEALGISTVQWKEIAKKLRNLDTPLSRYFATLGVRYEVRGAGKGAHSYLLRPDQMSREAA
jgi:hypothetical protein